MQDKVHLIRGRIEDTNLPVKKVDVLVSEWMGYFLLFEGMLDSFIYARDNHLTKGGMVLPNRCNISLIGCSDIGKIKPARNVLFFYITILFQNHTTI